jgi:tape measure domain-containing protein
MAEIGIRIVGEDQASFAFRAVSDSARATASEVSSLGDTWSNMSNVVSSGVLKAQAIIGLFQGTLSAAGNATAGIRSFIDMTVQMNATLEGTRGAFSVLLGSTDNANAMLEEMKVAARTTALSFEEFRNAGRYLLGFQFEAKEVVQITKDIGAAVYALGAKEHGGMQRIIRALGQMKAQGRVSREELNQLAEVGVPALKMLADSFGVTTAEMSQMVRKGAVPVEQAINGIIGQFRSLYGATGDQMANNFTVMSSNLQDFVDQAKLAIGSGVFVETRRQLETLTSIVGSPVFLQLAQQIGDTLGGQFRKLNETAILPALQALNQFMLELDTTNANPSIIRLMDNLNNIFGTLVGEYLGPAGVGLVKNFTTALSQLGIAASTLLRGGNVYEVFNQLSRIGQDTAAGQFVAKLAQEFMNLQTSLMQLRQYLGPVLQNLSSELGRLSNSDFMKSIIDSLNQLFTITDGKGNTFQLEFGNIVAAVNAGLQNLAQTLERFGGLFSQAIDRGKVQPLVDAISGALNNIMTNVDTWGANTLDRIVAWLAKIFNPSFDSKSLEGRVGDTIGNLKLIISGLSDSFSEALGEGLFPKLAPRVTAIGAWLMDQVGIILTGLGSFIADRMPLAFEMGFNAVSAAWANWNDRWKLQVMNDISATIGDPIDNILASVGLQKRVTAALQNITFQDLGGRVDATNAKLREQQSLLQEQMNNLPSIDKYFSGLGNIASLKGAFDQISSNASGPAIDAGRTIVSGVSTGVSSQLPEVASTISATATQSLNSVANSLAVSSSLSSAWQNVGYSLATAVSRGYNSGFSELMGTIQTTLGIPSILEKLNKNTVQIASLSQRITSLVTENQLKDPIKRTTTLPRSSDVEDILRKPSVLGLPSSGGSARTDTTPRTLYTVNNNVNITTTDVNRKAYEGAAAYVALRGVLNPTR